MNTYLFNCVAVSRVVSVVPNSEVEPRCRCALQSATPFLLESLTWPSPTRAELAAACIRSHQMDFDPFAVAEPMSMRLE